MAWGIVYFKAKDGRVLVEDFLDGCPAKIEARFYAVLEAVRDAPPPQFSGGGYWEAMHGDMGGFHEIRLTGLAAASIGSSASSTMPIQTDCGNAVLTDPRSRSLLAWSRTRARNSLIAITPRSGRWAINISRSSPGRLLLDASRPRVSWFSVFSPRFGALLCEQLLREIVAQCQVRKQAAHTLRGLLPGNSLHRMANDPTRNARAAVKRAQSKFARTGSQHEKAREARRESFELARKAGLTLREIGEAADLHLTRVKEILDKD